MEEVFTGDRGAVSEKCHVDIFGDVVIRVIRVTIIVFGDEADDLVIDGFCFEESVEREGVLGCSVIDEGDFVLDIEDREDGLGESGGVQ